MRQHSRPLAYAVFCLALLPACLTFWLILEYGVDVPYWDQWEIAVLIEKFSQGTLRAADLFAQHNEYRQFFPNLIFVTLGWLTRWNIRYEMLVSFLLACLVSFNIYRLARVTVGGSESRRLWLFFISNLLIFSPVQYENWLFGIQVIYYMPIACITSCMVIACSGLRERTKFFLCACLATVSTFSSVNGILCWVVVLPVLMRWRSRDEPGGKNWLVFAWVAGFAISVALYSYGLTLGNGLSEQPLVHPLRALVYFLAFLGGPLGIGGRPLFAAVPVGAASVLIFASSWAFFLKHSTDSALARRLIVWLMIGTYSVVTAAMVTVGRLSYGVGQSLSSRYTAFSLYLMVSLIYLVPIILEELVRGPRFAKRGLRTQLATLAAIFLVLAHLLIFPLAIRHGANTTLRQRLHAKACLLLINIVADECAEKLYPKVDQLRPRANVLDRLGFLRPPLVKSDRVRDIEAAGAGNPAAYGSFESLDRPNDDTCVASGWATLPGQGGPPDAVILAYENADTDFIVFALAEMEIERGFRASLLHRDGRSGWRWRKSFPLSRLPTIPSKLNAWAFDATTGRAYKLGGEKIAE